MTGSTRARATVADLQKAIAQIEGRVTGFDDRKLARSFDEAGHKAQPWRLGTDALDRYLPHGLALRGVHDITPESAVFTPAASLFAQCLVQRFLACSGRRGPVALVQVENAAREHGRFYGPHCPDLAQRLVLLRVHHQRDLAQTLEDAVRTQGLAAVIGEGGALPFKVTKRLDQASQKSAVPAVLVHACGSRDASAAMTRWMLRPARGPGDRDDPQAPGAPSFHLRLSRLRGPSSGSLACPGDDRVFHVLWNPATLAFDLVSPLRDGQASGDGASDAPVPAGTERADRSSAGGWRRAG
ncbi:MAG: hypothetical protein KI785_01600 [Devosiaceae bacterium]|nr:hypothetical protein [Devosiaceae bacterium MH13]